MKVGEVDVEEVRKAMASFDWEEAFYDPLHNTIEADTQEDRLALNRMEKLIEDLQYLFFHSKEGRSILGDLVNRYWSGKSMEQQLPILFALNDEHEKMHHVILENAFAKCQKALDGSDKILVYNRASYFLCAQDLHFFETELASKMFIQENRDRFTRYETASVVSIQDIESLYSKIPSQQLNATNSPKHQASESGQNKIRTHDKHSKKSRIRIR
ncbi:MAG: hypothetical protein DI535_03485 [Citrobacter freundii]|nr:MAG: hypothetical protein DI535_03485 [Citrobacter freundii]